MVPKVTQAARELVDVHGYAEVSMAMIADTADVGRQTVYRRWRSKADLILDAFIERGLLVEGTVAEGPVSEMLATLLSQIFSDLEKGRRGFSSLIAAAQSDEAFKVNFNERLSIPSDEMVVAILRKGVDRGELPSETDLDMKAELIHGAIWYRYLLGRPLDGTLATKIVAEVIG